MSLPAIPMPPPDLRAWVGPMDPADYDNPTGLPLLQPFGIPHQAYSAVFDFGCGCGRQARQLLQQQPRPGRYVGIDVRRDLVEWCQQNLTLVDEAFTFVHHDVYSPWYAPDNTLRLAQPFPVPDAAFSLILGNSVFTHLMQSQVEFYLSELARILSSEGVAYTSWLFFDRASFPFIPHVYSLHTSAIDFGQAALYDREWFLATVRKHGLAVQRTLHPPVPGHQWNVFLVHRKPGMTDQFPLGADSAEWVSGATLKPMAVDVMPPPELAGKIAPVGDVYVQTEKPQPPPLFGYLAEADAIRRTLEQMKSSRAWAIGRALTKPMRMLKKTPWEP